jgi:predicted metal-binding membrane protein
MGRYGRGAAAAFRLGRGHGIFCLGCCWALMLLMFAAGVASFVWMAVLTALMVYEKTAPGGRRLVPIAGVALLALAALTFATGANLIS